MKRRAVIALLAGVAFACDCRTVIKKGGGELQLAQNSLDFGETCVKPQDPTLEVLPIEKTLTVKNVGRGALVLTQVSVETGKGFQVKSDWPGELPVGGSYDLTVSFLPETTGTQVADLTVDDDQSDVKPAVARLVGMGSSVTPNPIASLHCPGGRPNMDGSQAERCWDTANGKTSSNPLMWFTDTIAGQTSDMELKFTNDGCATLIVDSVVVTADPGSSQPDAFVAVDASGTVIPAGGASGFRLTGGTGADRPTQVARIRFAPKVTDTFRGTVTVTTNVPEGSPPKKQVIVIQLLGAGVQPSLELCTQVGALTACATPLVQLTCDFTPPSPPACTGSFEVRNSGSAALDVTGIKLDRNNPQFSVVTSPALPRRLSSGDPPVAIAVQYAPAAAFNYDILTVVSTGGTKQAVVQGGSPPRLEIVSPCDTTAPDDVDFNKDGSCACGMLPNGTVDTRTFKIKNVGLGDLKVAKVFFRDTGSTTWPLGAPRPIFEITPPPPNTVVPPNTSTDVVVKFTDPPNGGPNSGTTCNSARYDADLKVETDDPLWPPPNGQKTVLVHAKTPCNPNPIAALTGQGTAQKDTTVTLDGSASYDYKPDSTGACTMKCTQSPPAAGCPANPIRKWDWKLQTVPATAGPNVSLTPTGIGTSPAVQLKLGSCAPCSYVVRLWTYDDTPASALNPNGLKSNYTDFTVNVTQ